MTQESIRVLIIEDDIAIAEVNHKYLSQIDGFEVVGIATSQHEAEIQVDILKPQLVLLDVYLPDGNGLDILRYLRQQQHQCDVILITAARDVDTLQQAMRGGVVDYLLKPVIFSRLESALNKYKHRLTGFEQASSLDQGLVDKMFQTPSVDGEGNQHTLRLPKGIDGVTLDKIRCLFKQETGQLTADEAGEKIGASRTTARRYLEYLITTGELVADLSYGTVGRPERSYKKVVR
ncbi:MAG TPA: two-component system response regulator [Vibrio sp.]|uniref:response regulator n=1 Tax=Vibrio TaxID=662 RepID=UPI000EBC33D5|nr:MULTISPECIES: response regulator [Vibrio]HCH01564.1 two-component system response regulator [Vibrio sp.]